MKGVGAKSPTSLSLTIVSAPIISLCLGPSCKVLFSLKWPNWPLDRVGLSPIWPPGPLDRVGFSPNWPPGPLDRVLWDNNSDLASSKFSLGWVRGGARFSLVCIFGETSLKQVLAKLDVLSLRIDCANNPGWFSTFSLCGFSLFWVPPTLSLVCGPPRLSLACAAPKCSVFWLHPKFSVFLRRTRGLCSGVTSAARTKWVGSGPLSTPEIENDLGYF